MSLSIRFRGKKEVRKSAKYEMSYEEEVAALVIHKTEPDDADVYRCEVSNPLGRVQTEGTLSVHSELCFYQKDEEQLKIRKLISFFYFMLQACIW